MKTSFIKYPVDSALAPRLLPEGIRQTQRASLKRVSDGVRGPTMLLLESAVTTRPEELALLFKVITDVLERSGIAMLVCVLIAIGSGTRLSLLLLVTLSLFLLLGALNAYRSYVAYRRGQPVLEHYLDALTNALVSISIYATIVLFGLRVF